ncbi:MAG TPA: SBBP repeat-containing protein, partial [Anaerolineae bacterium]|nr:SBBP repeat-containing protein [Anaerolineae bacterium]
MLTTTIRATSSSHTARLGPILLALLLILLPLTLQRDAALGTTHPTRPSQGLPLLFIANVGQAGPDVQMEALGRSGTVAFQSGAVELSRATRDHQSLRIEFVGANLNSRPVGTDQQPSAFNYFYGTDSARWRTNLSTYAALTYTDLYEGIELRYDGFDGQLKGTYTVAPGHDPDRIRWRYAGADDVSIDPASGDLHITLDDTQLIERAPIAWQVRSGVKVPIGVRYAAQREGAIGFAIDSYDPALPLVIDPTLIYGTYLGALSNDIIHDIGLDTAGNIYVTGWTYNHNLGGFPNTRKGSNDAYVAKLNAAGTAWQWVTYLGGGQDDKGYGLTLDGNSAVWVTGYTNSTDFPVTVNALQSTLAGGYDVMLTRLNAATGAVTYSTLYGFDLSDRGQDVAVDGQGNVYLTGQLNANDVLAMKLSGGTDPALVYGVRWGDDTGVDEGYAIAVDDAGKAYITGMTENSPTGSSFEIVNGVQTACGPYTYDTGDKDCTKDAFVSVINAAGDLLVYSTLLGGGGSPQTSSGADEGRGIALDNDGNIYV